MTKPEERDDDDDRGISLQDFMSSSLAPTQTVPNRKHGRVIGALTTFFLYVVPWTAAIVGWIVAAAFILYSHGQSDRVRTTLQQTRNQLAKMNKTLAVGLTAQDYVSTPNARLMPFETLLTIGGHPSVTLLLAPTYLHGVIVARGLPGLQTGQYYDVWARTLTDHLVSIGNFSPAVPGAETATVVVAPAPLDRFRAIYVDVESVPGVQSPTGAMVFVLRLAKPK